MSKGSRQRPTDKDKFDMNFEKIFNDPSWKNGPEDQEVFPDEPEHLEPEDDPNWVEHGSQVHNQHD
tara:strand:- start:334 stop:531 length:198 start_codon:yes stop_codon:yes gene_type:complete